MVQSASGAIVWRSLKECLLQVVKGAVVHGVLPEARITGGLPIIPFLVFGVEAELVAGGCRHLA